LVVVVNITISYLLLAGNMTHMYDFYGLATVQGFQEKLSVVNPAETHLFASNMIGATIT